MCELQASVCREACALHVLCPALGITPRLTPDYSPPPTQSSTGVALLRCRPAG